MKNLKTITFVTATVLGLSTIFTGCGNKEVEDTGVIINAGDTNNDSSSNNVVEQNTDTNAGSIQTIENAEVNESETVEEINTDMTGTWATDIGDVMQFDTDGKYSGFDVASGQSNYGTYESDGSTYIKVTITGLYEVAVSENGEEIQTPLEDKVINYTIKSIAQTDAGVTMIITDSSNEITLNKVINSSKVSEEEESTEYTEVGFSDLSDEEQQQILNNLAESGVTLETETAATEESVQQ